MAREFRHDPTADPNKLCSTDWQDLDTHRFESQAIGDIPYADTVTQVKALSIGTNNDLLTIASGKPAWQSPAAVMALLSGQAAAAFSLNSQELTNAVLNASVLKGTFTASGTVTLPAVTLGGNLDVNAKKLQNIEEATLGAAAAVGYLSGLRTFANQGDGVVLRTYNASDVPTARLTVPSGYDTAILVWAASQHNGMLVNGLSFVDNQDIWVTGGVGGNIHFGARDCDQSAGQQLNFCIEPRMDATAVQTTISSNLLFFKASYWSGGVANDMINEFFLELTDAAPYARYVFEIPQATPIMYLGIDAGGAYLGSQAATSAFLRIMAQDTGVGLVEVAKIVGAADPYFSMGGSQQQKFYNSGICTIAGATITLGGNMDAGGYKLLNLEELRQDAAAGVMYISNLHTAANAGTEFVYRNYNNVDSLTNRLVVTGGVATSVWTFSASTISGLDITSGQVLKVAGTQVVGAQGAAVADATDAASVILRLNDLLARCRAHGLIAT